MVGLCVCTATRAQLPSGFTNSKIQEGYTSPMGVVFQNDGQRMFSWDKSGHLYASNWNGATYIRQAATVLDLSEEVGDWRDFGLLSICLDPNFNTTGLIYLFYAVDRHYLLNFGTPQYSATTNDYFKPSIFRVARYRLNLGTTVSADYTSRRLLLGETQSTGIPLAHESHGGGTLLFGRDGSLLLSTGDNASYTSTDRGSAPETYWQQAINDGIMRPAENVGAFRSQMLTSMCGKILRLDPNTGDGLASNPHFQAGTPRSATSRMWAMGLRNPFRMTLQPNTGSTNPADANPGIIHLSDVGYVTWEDYHIIHVGGLNLGWPVYEGQTATGSYYDASAITFNSEDGNASFQSRCVQPTSPMPAADPRLRRFTHYRPAIAWKHGVNEARLPAFTGTTPIDPIIGTALAPATGTPFGGNCATGILYYTGTAFGAAYQNTVFFSDYATNWIRVAETHNTDNHWLHNVREFAPAGFTAGIVCMAQCPVDQSVYYVNVNNGTIYKIAFGGNRPPVAVAGADRTSGTSPMTVNFNSTGSNDPDGTPISYAWDFGDGTTSTLPNPQKTFTATVAQAFTVRLTVRDAGGLTDSKTLTISLNSAPPTVQITNPTNNTQ
jgi:glucose/arabinose dehydrogenase